MARRNDPLGALLFTVGLLGVAVVVDQSIKPIAGISGSPDEVKLQREKIREWAKIHLVGKKFYCPALPGKAKYVTFSNNGIKHGTGTTYGDPLIEFQALRDLPYLLTTAKLESSEVSKYAEGETVYWLSSNWQIQSGKYSVWIVVREHVNGSIYYDHGVIKKA